MNELLGLAMTLGALLAQADVDTGNATTHIVPVVVGSAAAAVAVSARLADAGLFVPAIRPPSVPEGRSLVRVSLSWHHTAADVERLTSTIRAILHDRSTM